MEQKRPITCLVPFPEAEKEQVDQLLMREIRADEHKLVVLDDDPTGVQTVHDISVYTGWSRAALRRAFAEPNKMFFVLTNSRGMTAGETTRIHREIMANLAAVSRETDKPYLVISRSDSTLRGHYPLETALIRSEMEKRSDITVDGEILCPFFREGGRFTLDDVHYVRTDNELVPAAQTEFARDKTFGYTQSNLKKYIEEKTDGRVRTHEIISFSVQELRARDYDAMLQKLLAVHAFGRVIVNAVDLYDVKVFCTVLYRALHRGRHYCFRSAAALAQVMGGVAERPLLTRREMIPAPTANGGIIMVGSHTQKTTAQLTELLKLPHLLPIEMNSDLVLTAGALEKEAQEITRRCEQAILAGQTPVVYTCRKLLTVPNDTPEAALKRSVKISEAVQSVVHELSVQPAFVIAKGGITSSDIGVKALEVERATVLGQICPGVPVWQTGAESRFPGVAYIIFPGNVGTADTLRKAAELLLD